MFNAIGNLVTWFCNKAGNGTIRMGVVLIRSKPFFFYPDIATIFRLVLPSSIYFNPDVLVNTRNIPSLNLFLLNPKCINEPGASLHKLLRSFISLAWSSRILRFLGNVIPGTSLMLLPQSTNT